MVSDRVKENRDREEKSQALYLVDEEYLVTALVPSDTACLASSPGRMRRTEVWISREEMVDFLLYAASLLASVATRSKMSLTKEFKMDMARLEIPVSGWTCLRTKGCVSEMVLVGSSDQMRSVKSDQMTEVKLNE